MSVRCGGCGHAVRAHTAFALDIAAIRTLTADELAAAPREHCRLCDCVAWEGRRRHVWRDDVTEAWMTATLAWLAERERVGVGYAAETAEFEAAHPRPRLGDFMKALSLGSPPADLERLLTPAPHEAHHHVHAHDRAQGDAA